MRLTTVVQYYTTVGTGSSYSELDDLMARLLFTPTIFHICLVEYLNMKRDHDNSWVSLFKGVLVRKAG